MKINLLKIKAIHVGIYFLILGFMGCSDADPKKPVDHSQTQNNAPTPLKPEKMEVYQYSSNAEQIQTPPPSVEVIDSGLSDDIAPTNDIFTNSADSKEMKDTDLVKDTELVSVSKLDPTIMIDISFSHENNPFNYRFFRENTAYLRFGVARKLVKASKDFAKDGLRLKIWSAYRPFNVQVKMFDIVKGNANWVSDPYKDQGKKTHVRGVAVDCTLVDEYGEELAMPTPYLDFDKGSEKMKTTFMKLPADVLKNREKLASVMKANGFEPYVNEWWHFQDKDWKKYPVVEMHEFPKVHKAILVDELAP